MVAGYKEEKTPRKRPALFAAFDGASQKEESPWRGINRKERLFVDDELEA